MPAIKFWASVVVLLTGPTTTIALLLVGLPGTFGDAMTWLSDWLPTAGQFVFDHAGYLTPAWALSLFGAVLLGWLHLPELRKRRGGAAAQTSAEQTEPLQANPAAAELAYMPASMVLTPPVEAPSGKAEPPSAASMIETAEDRQAKHELAFFAAKYVLPACEAQETLQLGVLHRICGPWPLTEKLAKHGLRQWPQHEAFHKARDQLVDTMQYSGQNLTLQQLMEITEILSRTYPRYCTFSDSVCRDANIDYTTDEMLRPMFEDWVRKNELIVAAYARFRENPFYTNLYDISTEGRQGQGFFTVV